MPHAAFQFHLMAEPAGDGPIVALEVPADTLTALETDEAGRLVTRGVEVAGELCFELLAAGGERHLVMHVPPQRNVRVNGSEALPHHVLGVGDEVRVDERLLWVSAHSSPHLGPAAGEHVGRECPICLLPIEPEQIVVACVWCGAVYHHGRDNANLDELQCGRTISTCSVCMRPLVREPGWQFVPQVS